MQLQVSGAPGMDSSVRGALALFLFRCPDPWFDVRAEIYVILVEQGRRRCEIIGLESAHSIPTSRVDVWGNEGETPCGSGQGAT